MRCVRAASACAVDMLANETSLPLYHLDADDDCTSWDCVDPTWWTDLTEAAAIIIVAIVMLLAVLRERCGLQLLMQ